MLKTTKPENYLRLRFYYEFKTVTQFDAERIRRDLQAPFP